MPLDALLKSSQTKSALTGFLGGAAGGALISSLTKKKTAQKLLKTGGLVALGGVAWEAVNRYRASQAGTDSVDQPDAMPPAQIDERQQLEQNANDRAGLLLSAMIAAAHADGHLTAQEQTQIWQKAIAEGLRGDDLESLQAVLNQPPSVEALVASATDFDTKLELYSASHLVIDETCEQGQAYLSRLAGALGLPQPLIDAVHGEAATA